MGSDQTQYFTLSGVQGRMKVLFKVVELAFYRLRISRLRSSVWDLVAVGNDSGLFPFTLSGKGTSDRPMSAALSSTAQWGYWERFVSSKTKFPVGIMSPWWIAYVHGPFPLLSSHHRQLAGRWNPSKAHCFKIFHQVPGPDSSYLKQFWDCREDSMR